MTVAAGRPEGKEENEEKSGGGDFELPRGTNGPSGPVGTSNWPSIAT